jgi:hypothetical protein
MEVTRNKNLLNSEVKPRARKFRAYEKFWVELKTARYSNEECCKSITVRLPSALEKRFIKAIIKEKDIDWDFKQENYLDPYRISFTKQIINEGSKAGNAVILLTIRLTKRSDF